MTYYAHSAKGCAGSQTYAEHIQGVSQIAKAAAQNAAAYNSKDGRALVESVQYAATYHDLGKLDEQNQHVLRGELHANLLPVNHVDAGVAYCLNQSTSLSIYPALAVFSHHKGLPNLLDQFQKGQSLAFRDAKIRQNTDNNLTRYIGLHNSLTQNISTISDGAILGDSAVFMRMMLSCLADGDHSDTAKHYETENSKLAPLPLLAKDRLAQLNLWAERMQAENMSSRNRLRSEMYKACRDVNVVCSITACDSPVGSGKTTAVMAHMLRQAERRGLRRIFIVLPFTNIIQQSVEVYRRLLTLPGENPQEVIAELHHRADFTDQNVRHLSAQWRAPIVVTTAVAFFETIASASPSALRKLHELPGSAIFVDEAHAALPTPLLPLTWKWINILANEWGCYWVLASGSLCRFWQIDQIRYDKQPKSIPQIVNEELRSQLNKYEQNRIIYKNKPDAMTAQELIEWLPSLPGPRIVILNTVMSAATVAQMLKERFGSQSVEHLSTALIPSDRTKTLKRIKHRLACTGDSDWTLVATSCVEAGIDLSFRSGARQLGPLSSLMQAAGRVNREGKYIDAEMWTFRISEGSGLIANPGIKEAAKVLDWYFEQGYQIDAQLTTQSISDEIALYGMNGKYALLQSMEQNRDFPGVSNNYQIIDSDTCLTVVDSEIAQQIKNGELNWKQVQLSSLQISRKVLEKYHALQITEDAYFWPTGYDSFIGYMKGIVRTDSCH